VVVFGVGSRDRDRRGEEENSIQRRETITLAEFRERADGDPDEKGPFSVELLSDRAQLMADDLGDFPFRPRVRSPLLYPPWGVALHRNSYSDWHYHPFAEGLMCQLVGTKEVLLMSPDRPTWSRLKRMCNDELHYYGIGAHTKKYPEVMEIVPWRTIIEPSDALFIPVYWWHAVQAVTRWAITVPNWWQSSWRICLNPKYPATRIQLKYWLEIGLRATLNVALGRKPPRAFD
jgi:hypothetical protein